MKIAVDFSAAPDTVEWAAVLAEDGWKITDLKATTLEAEKVMGNTSSYPERQLLHWYVSVRESGDSGLTISLEVPVFADSIFSRQRLLSTIETYVRKVEGECVTETSFHLQLLRELRD